MIKRILLLGSTGSIGTQALEVIASNPDKFRVVGIAAGGSQPDLVVQQARELGLRPDQVAVASSASAEIVARKLGGSPLSGTDSAEKLVRSQADNTDTVLNGLVGSIGLHATVATLELGLTLALANKESLVAGGAFVRSMAQPGQLVPVDSEHSAMAQCLRSGRESEVSRLVLTASGGPFRGCTREEMWDVTPQQAAAHPTWSMGQMNTLNSATLVNKGLELIEASLLFDIDPRNIEVTVHPQSIVHSAVTFCDGATIAQASLPSMKLPISLALHWPDRVPEAEPAIDFTQSATWSFEPVDNTAFPAVELAREVAVHGGTYTAVYNAANEEAAQAFLNGGIHFPQIVDVISSVLENASEFALEPHSVHDIIQVETEARLRARDIIKRIAVAYA